MNEKEKVLQEAKAENPITLQALLTEIKEAVDELFVASIQQENNVLYMHFLNGQRFALTVKEL